MEKEITIGVLVLLILFIIFTKRTSGLGSPPPPVAKKTCNYPARTCSTSVTDLTCPSGYDTKDISGNRCVGYTLANVASVTCPTGFSKAAGNVATCAPSTDCVIAPGYAGAGGACS